MKNIYQNLSKYPLGALIVICGLYFSLEVFQTYFQRLECDDFWFFILIFNELFLVYSATLRPEIMICWLAIFSFLFILEKKIFWAGLFAGIALVISQKAAWYIVACDLAIVSSIFFRGYFYQTI